MGGYALERNKQAVGNLKQAKLGLGSAYRGKSEMTKGVRQQEWWERMQADLRVEVGPNEHVCTVWIDDFPVCSKTARLMVYDPDLEDGTRAEWEGMAACVDCYAKVLDITIEDAETYLLMLERMG